MPAEILKGAPVAAAMCENLTERIARLRRQMAADAAMRYLRDLENLGLTRADAICLLNEKEETNNA